MMPSRDTQRPRLEPASSSGADSMLDEKASGNDKPDRRNDTAVGIFETSPTSESDGAHYDAETASIKPVNTRASHIGEKGLGLIRKLTAASEGTVEPPPDGGLVGWRTAGMTHLVIMATWGLVNSFGIFQTYYATILNTSPSNISWIGSIQVFLLFFISTFSGRLTDAGYFRQVFFVGSFLQVFGLFMLSLSTEYYQILLAQGICCGVGSGLVFCPAITIVSQHFSKHRAVAIGIGASGSAVGGLIFPTMVQQLLPQIGFGWTIRTVAFIQLFCFTLTNIYLRPRIPPRKTGPLVELGAFKELPYLFFSLGMYFTFWGAYFPFYYLSAFSEDIIGTSYDQSIDIILILNGIGLPGRIIPSIFADRSTGPLNLLIPAAGVSGLIAYCWIGVSDAAGLYAWAVSYGFTAAAIQGLFPAALTSLSTDMQKLGTRVGQVFTIVGFAALTGPPIGGALVEKGNGSYTYAQVFAGSSLVLGCGLLVASRIARTGLTFKVRV